MPLLPKNASYTANIGDVPLSGGRRATAQDFGAPGLGETGLVEAGHRVMSIAQKQLSDMEESEARQALVQSTEIRAEYSRRLDEAALSGADLGKLKEEMSTALSKVGDKFQTKRGAEQLQLYTADSAIMYDQQANQIAVQRASIEARAETQSFINNAAKLIQRNAGYLDVAVKDGEDLIASRPGVSPAVRADLKERLTKELNLTAAISSARLDPASTKQRLQDGDWNLTPEQRQSAMQFAEREEDGQRRDRDLQRQEKDRLDREAVDKARGNHLDALRKGTLTWASIRDDPAFASQSHFAVNAQKELMIMMDARRESLANKERKGDQKLMNDMWLQINSREVFNPSVVVAAVKDHLDGKPGLDTRQADYLLGQMRSLRDGGDQTYRAVFASEMRRQQAALSDDIMLSATPEGIRTREAIFSAIRGEAEAAAEKRRTSTAKGQDPADLFDPNHKDYFFTKKNIETIKARVTQSEQSAAVNAAIAAGAKRVTGINDPVLREVKVGEMFVDENGNSRKMTEALKKRIGSAKAPTKQEFPVVPSGETPDKIAQREAAERAARYRAAHPLIAD